MKIKNPRDTEDNHHATRHPRPNPAQSPGRTLYCGRPAGGLARPVQDLRPRPVAGHHSQHHGRPGRPRLRGQSAHVGRARAHAARLPHLCRYLAHRAAVRRAVGGVAHAPAGAAAAKNDFQCRADVVVAIAVCRRGAQPAPRIGVPADRILAPGRKTHLAGHRRPDRRRPEPHAAHRCRLQSVAAGAVGQLHQPELRRPVARRSAPSPGGRSTPVARRYEPVDAGGGGSGQRSDGRRQGRHGDFGRAQPALGQRPVEQYVVAAADVRHVRAKDRLAAAARHVEQGQRRADLYRRRIEPGADGRNERGDRAVHGQWQDRRYAGSDRPHPHGVRAGDTDRGYYGQAVIERAQP